MSVGVGAKRQLKRVKREAEEQRNVVTALEMMLSNAGYKVDFPWQIPGIVQELLQGAVGRYTGIPGQPPIQMISTDGLFGSMEDFSDPAALDIEDAEDPFASSFDVPSAGSVGELGLSMEEMQAIFEQKQEAHFSRVAQTGIQHQGGLGPEEYQGQKMSVDPDALRTLQRTGSPTVLRNVPASAPTHAHPPQGARGNPFAGMGSVGNVPIHAVPSPTPSAASAASADPPSAAGPGRVNPLTGLSREQQAAIIERATGKKPRVPEGSGIPKLL